MKDQFLYIITPLFSIFLITVIILFFAFLLFGTYISFKNSHESIIIKTILVLVTTTYLALILIPFVFLNFASLKIDQSNDLNLYNNFRIKIAHINKLEIKSIRIVESSKALVGKRAGYIQIHMENKIFSSQRNSVEKLNQIIENANLREFVN